MTADSWIVSSLGAERVRMTSEDAGRRRLRGALGLPPADHILDEDLRFVASSLELAVLDLLDVDDRNALRGAAAEAFQIARTVPLPGSDVAAAEQLGAGGLPWRARRSWCGRESPAWRESLHPSLPTEDADWGTRVWAIVLDTWLRLFRKQGWDDLDRVLNGVAALRRDQAKHEPAFLERATAGGDARPAWSLCWSTTSPGERRSSRPT